MRANGRSVALEASADALFPASSDPVPGLQRLPSLLRAILRAHSLDWQGTLHVRDEHGRTLCTLHAEAGWLIVGGADAGQDGRTAVRQACWSRAAHVTIVADRGRPDDVSSATHLMDPLALASDVVRSGLLDDAVSEAIAAIGGKSFKLQPHARSQVERYGLRPEERQILQRLAVGPLTLTALRECSPVCSSTVQRLVFLLWVTESLSVVPLWLSVPERESSEPRPGASYIRSVREDEPTRVVRSDTPPDAMTPRESAPRRLRRHATLPYGSQVDMQPAHRVDAQVALRERADAHFHAAEVLHDRGFAREAVFEAQKALRLCEPWPAQRALYAYLLFVTRGLRPGVESRIEQHLSQALREDSTCERTRHYAARIRQKRSS